MRMTTRHSRSGNSPGSRQALSQGDYISASAEEYMVRKARKADTIRMSPARGPWRRALYIRRYSIPFGLHFALPDLRAFALSYSKLGSSKYLQHERLASLHACTSKFFTRSQSTSTRPARCNHFGRCQFKIFDYRRPRRTNGGRWRGCQLDICARSIWSAGWREAPGSLRGHDRAGRSPKSQNVVASIPMVPHHVSGCAASKRVRCILRRVLASSNLRIQDVRVLFSIGSHSRSDARVFVQSGSGGPHHLHICRRLLCWSSIMGSSFGGSRTQAGFRRYVPGLHRVSGWERVGPQHRSCVDLPIPRRHLRGCTIGK